MEADICEGLCRNVDGTGMGLEESLVLSKERAMHGAMPARWPMHRVGGRAHGLAPFTSLRVDGYSIWNSAGFIQVRARVIPCGYGKITWAGYGRRTNSIPFIYSDESGHWNYFFGEHKKKRLLYDYGYEEWFDWTTAK